VPVGLISGDRTTVEGALAHLPWLEGVVTKDSIGRFAVNSLSPPAARARIHAGAKRAIERAAEMRPFRFEPPIVLEIDFAGTQNADFAELIPGMERIGGRTTRFTHDDYAVVFKTFVAAFRLGASANMPV
jgi:D-amino peptidase